jgi:hypothetical protein
MLSVTVFIEREVHRLKVFLKANCQYHPGAASGIKSSPGNGRYPYEWALANQGGTAEVESFVLTY